MGVKLPAFQRLVDAYWEDVARLAHALAGPVHGDDVAQQAWAKALAAYPQLRSSANLRSWLLTITAHCAMDAYRADARQPLPVPDLAALDGAGAAPLRRPGTAVPYEGAPIAPQDVGDPLWVAVRSLPDRQRTAIALRYIADLDHAQIATALHTTSGASRRLVSDALSTLRAEFAAEPEPVPMDSIQENRP
jgi:DNA-directed RNA polymerase specialized sigma24 family protein